MQRRARDSIQLDAYPLPTNLPTVRVHTPRYRGLRCRECVCGRKCSVERQTWWRARARPWAAGWAQARRTASVLMVLRRRCTSCAQMRSGRRWRRVCSRCDGDACRRHGAVEDSAAAARERARARTCVTVERGTEGGCTGSVHERFVVLGGYRAVVGGGRERSSVLPDTSLRFAADAQEPVGYMY